MQASRGETVDVRLVLPGPGGVVEGSVLDPGGRPVAGAAVEVRATERGPSTLPDGASGYPPPPVRLGTTADGRFLARGLPLGTLGVTVRAHPHAIWTGTVDVSLGQTARLEARLAEGVILEGTLLDPDGKPARDAEVSVRPRAGFGSTTARTGPDGSFRLEGLACVEWKAVADAGAMGSTSAEFAPGPGERMRWDARLPGGRVFRRVVDETGAPLEGCRISVEALQRNAPGMTSRRLVVTDAQGRFEIRGLPDAPHRLKFGTTQVGQFPAVIFDDVRPAPTELRVTVPAAARPSAYIRGTVVGADGKPLSGVIVMPRNPDLPEAPGQPNEPETGSFSIGPLRPGLWELRFRARPPRSPDGAAPPRRRGDLGPRHRPGPVATAPRPAHPDGPGRVSAAHPRRPAPLRRCCQPRGATCVECAPGRLRVSARRAGGSIQARAMKGADDRAHF